MKRIKGFTLIELMITVAILGIFISIALGAMSGQSKEDNSLQKSLNTIEQKYILDPDLCFDEFKVEEARRDSSGTLYCKVDGKWEESLYAGLGE